MSAQVFISDRRSKDIIPCLPSSSSSCSFKTPVMIEEEMMMMVILPHRMTIEALITLLLSSHTRKGQPKGMIGSEHCSTLMRAHSMRLSCALSSTSHSE